MNWVAQLVVAIWAVTNDYAWFTVDTAAKFALVQANCTLPTPACLRQAKAVHVQLIKEHVDLYWRSVTEEAARLEHERQTKDVHDRYIAQQLAKADKWDRWEVSPPTIISNLINPTIISNFINPTMVSQTFVTVCAHPTEIPGLDSKALVAKRRPWIEPRITSDDGTIKQAVKDMFSKQIIDYLVECLLFWPLLQMIVFITYAYLENRLFKFTTSEPGCPTETTDGSLPSAQPVSVLADSSQGDENWDQFSSNLAIEMEAAFMEDAAEAPESPLESTLGTMASTQPPGEPAAASTAMAEEEKTSAGSAGEAKTGRKILPMRKRRHFARAEQETPAEQSGRGH